MILMLFALLALAQFCFTLIYLGHERALYFWDHAMYHMLAREFAATTLLDFSAGVKSFLAQLAGDYNLIFALPSQLSFALFGDSRLIFIATNFVCFFLPHEIATAFVLRRGFNISWVRALTLAAIAFCLIPLAWVPLLQGYPDNGAAAALAFACGILMSEKRDWKNALATGALMALTILLRRHFAYGVISVLLAFGLMDLRRVKNLRDLLPLSIFYALIAAASLAVLFAIAPVFTGKMLTVNYNELYQSYRESAWHFALYALDQMGYALLLALTVSAWLLHQTKPRFAAQMTLIGGLWLLLWGAIPRQLGPHYLLHVMPLVAAVFIAALVQTTLSNTQKISQRALAAALLLLLASGSALSLWITQVPERGTYYSAPQIFAQPNPPVVRADYNELIALGTYLRATTSDQDHITVVGSSFTFNADLLVAVYRDVIPAPEMGARFLYAPEIDFKQFPPYAALLFANIYVVPDMPQYHLDPAGQKNVTAFASLFPPSGAMAPLFTRDERQFKLQRGVTLSIWRRKAWTTEASQQAVDRINAIAGRYEEWREMRKRLEMQGQIAPNNSGL